MRNYIKKELENHPDFYSGRLSKRNIFRSLTSNQRTLPDFMIIGEAKCGTTSLYNYLIQHPNIESEREWLTENVYNGNFQGRFIEVTVIDKYKN